MLAPVRRLSRSRRRTRDGDDPRHIVESTISGRGYWGVPRGRLGATGDGCTPGGGSGWRPTAGSAATAPGGRAAGSAAEVGIDRPIRAAMAAPRANSRPGTRYVGL